MDINQIKDTIQKIFMEKKRIIFWYDDEKEFSRSFS